MLFLYDFPIAYNQELNQGFLKNTHIEAWVALKINSKKKKK